jgi:hypothetical protein
MVKPTLIGDVSYFMLGWFVVWRELTRNFRQNLLVDFFSSVEIEFEVEGEISGAICNVSLVDCSKSYI